MSDRRDCARSVCPAGGAVAGTTGPGPGVELRGRAGAAALSLGAPASPLVHCLPASPGAVVFTGGSR
jgi:hypothetical protein